MKTIPKHQICKKCNGRGEIFSWGNPAKEVRLIPCPECGGVGVSDNGYRPDDQMITIEPYKCLHCGLVWDINSKERCPRCGRPMGEKN